MRPARPPRASGAPDAASGAPAAASGASAAASGGSVAANAFTVARWTLLSRVSGLARVVVVAAVLGPTFFGNLFQAANALPVMAYELLTGSLLSSLLVPRLVAHVDAGRRDEVARLAGGFLGVVVAVFAAVAVLLVLAAPLLLGVLTVGVADAVAASAQRRAGLLLLALLLPQVALYGVAGVGAAVMQAHGRFALAAGAPVFENLGVIATLGVFAAWFGTGPAVEGAGTAQLVVLGVGATGAVAAHAAVQLIGAWCVSGGLRPRAGWRDPEVRELWRLARPSLGFAALNALRAFGALTVANSVRGGVVAYQMALNFYNLPVALAARPVSVAVLPRLARLAQAARLDAFRAELASAARLVLLLAVPAALGYLLLHAPIAGLAAWGEMAGPEGTALLGTAIAALAVGVVGESLFVLGTHGAYALDDAVSPLRAMCVRVAVTALVVALTFGAQGADVVRMLGVAVSAGDLAGAGWLGWRLWRALPAPRHVIARRAV